VSQRPNRAIPVVLDSGEVSYNGLVSRRGDKMARTYLYEAADAVTTRKTGGSGLRPWACAIAERTGPY
jgi:transposase